MGLLPEVLDTAADFGSTDLLGRPVPILGVAGDQQAATVGQACFRPGMIKSTYGTGCFAVLNTGDDAGRLVEPAADDHRLPAGRTDDLCARRRDLRRRRGGAVAARRAEGDRQRRPRRRSWPRARTRASRSIWCRPSSVSARRIGTAIARGALFGLTRGTGPAELARAALESVGYQTRDLLDAMRRDWRGEAGAEAGTVLRVDGGMAASDWTMQFLADICDAPVDRPPVLETTALGAAWLAGMRAGLYPSADGFAQSWRSERRFEPSMRRGSPRPEARAAGTTPSAGRSPRP